MFSCEFCQIFENTFFTERLWATFSVIKDLWLNFPMKKILLK